MTNYSIKSQKTLTAILVAISSVSACKEWPDLTTSEGRGKFIKIDYGS